MPWEQVISKKRKGDVGIVESANMIDSRSLEPPKTCHNLFISYLISKLLLSAHLSEYNAYSYKYKNEMKGDVGIVDQQK